MSKKKLKSINIDKLESKNKLKLKKFYENLHQHIKKNIKEKGKIIIITIIGDNGLWWQKRKKKKIKKKKEKSGNVTSGMRDILI